MQVNALPESSGSGTLLESLEVLSCDTIPRHYRAYIHFWNASDLNIFWFLRLPGDNRDSWDVRGLGRVQEHSVQFSCSVTSDSLRPHESHQARPPCPSSTPGVHPNSSASSQWCHPAISSSQHVTISNSALTSLSLKVFFLLRARRCCWVACGAFSIRKCGSSKHWITS